MTCVVGGVGASAAYKKWERAAMAGASGRGNSDGGLPPPTEQPWPAHQDGSSLMERLPPMKSEENARGGLPSHLPLRVGFRSTSPHRLQPRWPEVRGTRAASIFELLSLSNNFFPIHGGWED
jgi:hypothetical protein